MSIFGAACGTVAHDAPRGRSGERRPALGPLAPGFDGNCLTTSGDAAQRTLPSGSDTRFTSTTRGRPDGREVVWATARRGEAGPRQHPDAYRRRAGREEASMSGAACGTVGHDASRGQSGQRRAVLGRPRRLRRGLPNHIGRCGLQRTLPCGSGRPFKPITRGRPDDRGAVWAAARRGRADPHQYPDAGRSRAGREEAPISGLACGTVAHDEPRAEAARGSPSSAPPRRELTGPTPPHPVVRPATDSALCFRQTSETRLTRPS